MVLAWISNLMKVYEIVMKLCEMVQIGDVLSYVYNV